MRKITRQSVIAFFNGKPFKSGNTCVVCGPNTAHLYLHGNLIASRQPGRLSTTLAGWNTPTTRERLNGVYTIAQERGLVRGVPYAGYCQRNHKACYIDLDGNMHTIDSRDVTTIALSN